MIEVLSLAIRQSYYNICKDIKLTFFVHLKFIQCNMSHILQLKNKSVHTHTQQRKWRLSTLQPLVPMKQPGQSMSRVYYMCLFRCQWRQLREQGTFYQRISGYLALIMWQYTYINGLHTGFQQKSVINNPIIADLIKAPSLNHFFCRL